MDRMVAYCGLVCSDCRAYIATQSKDPAALERVAAQWREQFNWTNITADMILCDGCSDTDRERRSHYCDLCEIHACALERGVANCAYCADYACDKLEGFFAQAVSARAVLDDIRATL